MTNYYVINNLTSKQEKNKLNQFKKSTTFRILYLLQLNSLMRNVGSPLRVYGK